MSEQNDPLEATFRRLVADAGDDAPAPPSVQEMMQMPRPASDRADTKRRWVAGGTIGLVAAAVIALLVVPGGDDDAIRPVDSPLTVEPTSTASTATTAPVETVPSTTVDGAPATSVEAAEPTTVSTTPTTNAPTTTEPVATGPATVIAAVDDQGDAVLIPADGSDPLTVFDSPDPDTPAPEEGPGPTVVDSIALTRAGNTVFVGLCCEPIAGSILSGPPSDLGTQSTSFGYAPAFSPDGSYLAIGQIEGPALSITDLSTGLDLEVPPIDDEIGSFSPYDTMWLDASRVIGIGLASGEGRPRWVAIPMTVDDGQVTVGSPLNVSEVLPASDDGTPVEPPVVRFAGSVDTDRFAIHVPGEPDATSIDFRMDGVIAADAAAGGNGAEGVGEGARSIWYRPDAPTVWVGEDGTLHQGEETLPGTYQWARPTAATSVDIPEPPPEVSADVSTAIDLADASVFGLGYGTEAAPEQAIADIEPALGEPTFDTGWQPTPPGYNPDYERCFDPRFRTVWWGDFRLTFGEALGDERIRVASWSVGDPDVDTSAPLGELPPSRPASGVAADGVGVGSSRDEVLAVVPQDGRIIGDTEEGVFVTGAIVTTFDIDDADTVTAIGSGRLDCTAGPDL